MVYHNLNLSENPEISSTTYGVFGLYNTVQKGYDERTRVFMGKGFVGEE